MRDRLLLLAVVLLMALSLGLPACSDGGDEPGGTSVEQAMQEATSGPSESEPESESESEPSPLEQAMQDASSGPDAPEPETETERVSTEKFMAALREGLTNRYALGEIDPDLSKTDPEKFFEEMHARVACEWDALAPFDGAEFEDEGLGFLAQRYINSIKSQEELSRSADMSVFMFTRQWNAYGENRPQLLRTFSSKYGLELDDEYQPYLETAMRQDGFDEHVDEFTIVSAVRGEDDGGGYWEMEVTVRNNTDSTKTFMGFNVIELDADGNIVDLYMSYNKNYAPTPVEPGQEYTISLTESDEDGIAGFKSTGYVWTTEGGARVEGEFSEPYVTTF